MSLRLVIVALALLGSRVFAQSLPSLEIDLSAGTARDYYFFAAGHRWGSFYGARLSSGLARVAGGTVGLTALVDRYDISASATQVCAVCDQAGPSARVTRLALGPAWRSDVRRYELSTSALFGRVKRTYPSLAGSLYPGEDAESHAFGAGDAGLGARWRGMIVGARVELGITRSVIDARNNRCYLIDPLPGTTCEPPRHSPSYARIGVFVSYRLKR